MCLCKVSVIKGKNLHNMLRRVPGRLLKYSVANRGCHPSVSKYNIHVVFLPGSPKPQSPLVVKSGSKKYFIRVTSEGLFCPITLKTHDSRWKRQFCSMKYTIPFKAQRMNRVLLWSLKRNFSLLQGQSSHILIHHSRNVIYDALHKRQYLWSFDVRARVN